MSPKRKSTAASSPANRKSPRSSASEPIETPSRSMRSRDGSTPKTSSSPSPKVTGHSTNFNPCWITLTRLNVAGTLNAQPNASVRPLSKDAALMSPPTGRRGRSVETTPKNNVKKTPESVRPTRGVGKEKVTPVTPSGASTSTERRSRSISAKTTITLAAESPKPKGKGRRSVSKAKEDADVQAGGDNESTAVKSKTPTPKRESRVRTPKEVKEVESPPKKGRTKSQKSPAAATSRKSPSPPKGRSKEQRTPSKSPSPRKMKKANESPIMKEHAYVMDDEEGVEERMEIEEEVIVKQVASTTGNEKSRRSGVSKTKLSQSTSKTSPSVRSRRSKSPAKEVEVDESVSESDAKASVEEVVKKEASTTKLGDDEVGSGEEKEVEESSEKGEDVSKDVTSVVTKEKEDLAGSCDKKDKDDSMEVEGREEADVEDKLQQDTGMKDGSVGKESVKDQKLKEVKTVGEKLEKLDRNLNSTEEEDSKEAEVVSLKDAEHVEDAGESNEKHEKRASLLEKQSLDTEVILKDVSEKQEVKEGEQSEVEGGSRLDEEPEEVQVSEDKESDVIDLDAKSTPDPVITLEDSSSSDGIQIVEDSAPAVGGGEASGGRNTDESSGRFGAVTENDNQVMEDHTDGEDVVTIEPTGDSDDVIMIDGDQIGAAKRKVCDAVEEDTACKKQKTDSDNCHSNSDQCNSDDILKSYVVVDMADVPAADSHEISKMAAVPSTNHSTEALSTDCRTGPLYERSNVNNPAIDVSRVDSSRQFTLATYNVLADCMLAPLPEDATDAQRKAFSKSYRHARLMEEVRYLDCDVVCMQEVNYDYYGDYLKKDMTSLGYTGSYKKKIGETKWTDYGNATFFKSARFDLVSTEWLDLGEAMDKDVADSGLNDQDQRSVREFLRRPEVIIIDRLRCRSTGVTVTVGNIHVCYADMKYPNVQAMQIACAFREVLSRSDDGLTPHIVCGDFNQSPTQPGYYLAKDGYLSNNMINHLQSHENVAKHDGSKTSLLNLLWKSFQHSSSSAKSAYLTVQGCEPPYTKSTKHGAADYIFYSSSHLQALSVLSTPSLKDSMQPNTPTLDLHSDHLSLKATFTFK